ncbi:MAG: extracellular solute-binding protein, partial [Lachnospiraceae bacterium]|nr:extracellular solute-binding protein [Lachnospiraceae bacterium]
DTVEIPVALSENEKVNCFYLDENNDIFCMTSIGNGKEDTEENVEENMDYRMELVKLNPEGMETARINLQEQLPLAEESLLNRITVDGPGNIIIATDKTVYSLDSELQLVNKISAKEQYEIVNFVRTKSGKVVCGEQKKDLDSGESGIGSVLCILDTGKWEWGSFLTKVEHSIIDEYCFMESQEYDFYYKDGAGIYGHNAGEETWTKVMDARCSLLTGQDIDGMIGEEQGNFWGILSGSVNGKNGFVLNRYSKMNPEEQKDKKIITYAGYNVTNQLRIIAREFNKTHEDCRIEIKLYEDEDHTRLGMDIASGKAPDVFPLSSLEIPMEQVVRKGILEDLTPYYEKDTEIRIEDISPSVLEGMKLQGKLYSVAPFYQLVSAACRTSDTDGKEGWTVAEMKEILDRKGEGALAFDITDKSEILYEFLMSSLNEFINRETGECDFDSPEFKDILEFCNEAISTDGMSDEDYDELLDDIETKLQEGKVLLSASQGVTLDEIQLERQRFGADITYIGLPEKDRQGSYFWFREEHGIYSGSDVKEEAWEFIRMIMSEAYQINENNIGAGFFPTRKDCLEWKIQAEMTTEPYEDAYGNWIEPIETNIWHTESGEERKTGPASQDDVDILLDLIERTRKRVALDDESALIIIEEAQAYFNGDKSLDKTAEIIQKRMTTYVNEQR